MGRQSHGVHDAFVEGYKRISHVTPVTDSFRLPITGDYEILAAISIMDDRREWFKRKEMRGKESHL